MDSLTLGIYGIFLLLAILALKEFGFLPSWSKKNKIESRRMDFWVCEFESSGERRKIEFRQLINGQWFFKFSGLKYPIPLTPFVDLKPVSITPDNGKMLYKCYLDLYGQKPYHNNTFLSQQQFKEIKEKERELTALEEDKRKPKTSLEKTVSDGMDEDYAENLFMEKVRIAEAMAKGKEQKKGVTNEPKPEGK